MNWRDIFLPIKCDLQRMFVNLNFVVHPDCVFLSWKKIMAEQLQSDVMQTNIEAPQTASDRGKFLINRQFTTLKFKYWLQKSWFTMWIYSYSQINFSSQSFNMQNVIIFLTQFWTYFCLEIFTSYRKIFYTMLSLSMLKVWLINIMSNYLRCNKWCIIYPKSSYFWVTGQPKTKKRVNGN